MSSASEGGQAAASHSFWPKVLLWVVVIIFGFMYIRSVAHKDGAATGQESQVQPAVEQGSQAMEVQVDAVLIENDKGQVVGEAIVEEVRPAPEPSAAVAEAPEETGAPVTEAAAEEPAAEVAPVEPAPAETPAPVQEAGQAAEPVPVAESVPAPAAEEQSKAAEPAAVEEKAAAVEEKAEEAEHAAAPAKPAPARSMAEERRAKLMAEYESMRKAAEEERRRIREHRYSPYGGVRNGPGYPQSYYPRPYYGYPYSRPAGE